MKECNSSGRKINSDKTGYQLAIDVGWVKFA